MNIPDMTIFKNDCLLISPVEYRCPDAIVFLCDLCSTNERDCPAVWLLAGEAISASSDVEISLLRKAYVSKNHLRVKFSGHNRIICTQSVRLGIWEIKIEHFVPKFDKFTFVFMIMDITSFLSINLLCVLSKMLFSIYSVIDSE